MFSHRDLRFPDGLRLPGTGKRDFDFRQGEGAERPSWRDTITFSAAQVEFSAASARLQGPRGSGFDKAASIISARHCRLIRLLDAQLRHHALRAVAKMLDEARRANSEAYCATPYAPPEAGYSSRRPQPASGATGSAKVSATASHSSGDFTPRARMWSLASSLSRVLLS
jgi:hypothetical protein